MRILSSADLIKRTSFELQYNVDVPVPCECIANKGPVYCNVSLLNIIILHPEFEISLDGHLHNKQLLSLQYKSLFYREKNA